MRDYPTSVEFDGLKLPLAHQDRRRAIYERDLGEAGSLQYFIVNPNSSNCLVLGQHYHQQTEFEIFTIINGGGTAYRQMVNTQGRSTAGQTELQLEPGQRLVITQLTAHTLVLNPGSRIVCLRSQPWSVAQFDQHPYNVIPTSWFQ